MLTGNLKRFKSGEEIVRRGKRGDEMYVIIQGGADVWIGAGRDRHRITEMRRGDVFGEMGLVRGVTAHEEEEEEEEEEERPRPCAPDSSAST